MEEGDALPSIDLYGLEGWSDENQAATHALLAEYHNIFSLEPWRVGLYRPSET